MQAYCYYKMCSKIPHIAESPFFYVLPLFIVRPLKLISMLREHLSFQSKFLALTTHELFEALFLFISKENACHKLIEQISILYFYNLLAKIFCFPLPQYHTRRN